MLCVPELHCNAKPWSETTPGNPGSRLNPIGCARGEERPRRERDERGEGLKPSGNHEVDREDRRSTGRGYVD